MCARCGHRILIMRGMKEANGYEILRVHVHHRCELLIVHAVAALHRIALHGSHGVVDYTSSVKQTPTRRETLGVETKLPDGHPELLVQRLGGNDPQFHRLRLHVHLGDDCVTDLPLVLISVKHSKTSQTKLTKSFTSTAMPLTPTTRSR